jgi:phenylacetate-CoA ligase
MQFQLEQSQWWTPDALAAQQWGQLASTVEHAYHTVPFYRARFDQAGLRPDQLALPDVWGQLPILTRRDLQRAGDTLMSTDLPKDHGRRSERITGGSTGEPVRVIGTSITGFAWRVFTLRDHLWQRRDFRLKLAAIRFVDNQAANPPDGAMSSNWGSTTRDIHTGPCAVLSINSTTDEQAQWLKCQDPHYVLSYPSAIVALAEYFLDRRETLPNLREVRTFGEVVEPHVRTVCKEAWNVPVIDAYSSEEFGYLALQCPDHEHYHVQSENVLVEILNDEGEPCQRGEIGRVIVTSLHNFAMPLLRYEIGDYAEVGSPCSCGRGLPVLKQIIGRQRNMFVLPNGETRWPMIDAQDIAGAFDDLPPITKFQLVQKTVERLEANLVVARPLTTKEEDTIRAYLQRGLGYEFEVRFCYMDDIPRSPRGKFEEFRSEVTQR